MSEFIPTAEQADALAAKAPLLILAGAGTGKTTVVTHRIAELIASGEARPDQILALTFAEKAAAEMAGRLGTLLEERGFGEMGREVQCSTFHSFGLEVIQENALLLGRDGASRILSTPRAWQLLSSILGEVDFQSIDLTSLGLGSLFGRLLGFFSAAKDYLVGPDQLNRYLAGENGDGLSPVAAEYWEKRLGDLRDVAAAYRRYEEAKNGLGYLDYGDLLMLPVQLFRSHPELRATYHARYPYLFVDEYQDTNHAQRLLLLELLSPEARVVVIGDDDQSIYGWRGAVVQNILRFPEEAPIRAAGPSRQFLTMNRRSGPPILEVANAIISGVGDRYDKRLNYAPGAEPAQVGHYVAASDEAEGCWIADTIQRLHGRPEVEDPTGKKQGYGVFAVLCRKRSLFRSVASVLEERGIPYELVGGSGFFGRWEIKNVLSYLELLSDPTANIALARVLQLPPWRISDRDIFHLSQWARLQARKADRARQQGGQTADPEEEDREELRFRLFDALARSTEISGLSPDARLRLPRLQKLLDSLRRSAGRAPLVELVERVVEESGHRREMAAKGGFDAELALLNLQKLVELARQFGEDGGELSSFVDYVRYALESGDEESEVRPVDEGSDTVKVMTVHQAKGLEFPAVFLPGLVDRSFPDTRVDDPDRWDQFPEDLKGSGSGQQALRLRSVENSKDLKAAQDERKEALQAQRMDEERRLFYVAITRAQRALFMSRAHWYGGNSRPKQPSLFWEEAIDTGHSVCLGEEEAPESNPNLWSGATGGRKTEGRPKPLATKLLDPDRGAAWIAGIASNDGETWEQLKAEVDDRIAALSRIPTNGASERPVEVSCTGLVRYDQCPRLFRYLHVDRLPEKPSVWADRGTEMHRLIEEEAENGLSLELLDEDEPEPTLHGMEEVAELTLPGEEEGLPALGSTEAGVLTIASTDESIPTLAGTDEGVPSLASTDESVSTLASIDSVDGHGTPATTETLLENFRRSPYGQRRPTKVEEPFTLPLDGGLVRGRVDRMDRLPDGNWQLVDFKTARFPGEVRPGYRLQLQIYALAAWRLWGIPPERMTGHLFFLVDGHDATIHFTPQDLEDTERWVAEALGHIQHGEYPTIADEEACAKCGYGGVCGMPEHGQGNG